MSKSIIKLMKQHYDSVNQNPMWSKFFEHSRLKPLTPWEVQSIETFVKSSIEYRELMKRYWSPSQLNEQERNQLSAQQCGLLMPNQAEPVLGSTHTHNTTQKPEMVTKSMFISQLLQEK